jgi:hypothetical protein
MLRAGLREGWFITLVASACNTVCIQCGSIKYYQDKKEKEEGQSSGNRRLCQWMSTAYVPRMLLHSFASAWERRCSD